MNTNNSAKQNENALLHTLEYRGGVGYLAGTIHISFEGYHKISDLLLSVFEEEITHYFGETDMTDLAGIDQSSLSLDWRGLKNALTPAQFRKYREKLYQFIRVDLNYIEQLPPMFISSLIAANLAESHGDSIDTLLWNKAGELDLKRGGLESVAEQMEIYTAIPLDYQLMELKRMLKNLSKSRKSVRKLTRLYESQAIHEMYRQGKKTLGPIRNMMLSKRNELIVKRILHHLESTDGKVYFSLGAAHLAGEHGVIHGLKSKGCMVKPYPVSTSTD